MANQEGFSTTTSCLAAKLHMPHIELGLASVRIWSHNLCDEGSNSEYPPFFLRYWNYAHLDRGKIY